MAESNDLIKQIEEEDRLARLKLEEEEAERKAMMKATLIYFERTNPDMYYAICAFSASNVGSSIGNLYENIARYIIAEKLGVKNPLLKVTNGSIMIHKGVTSFSAQMIGELLYNKGYSYDLRYEDEETRPPKKDKDENTPKTMNPDAQTVPKTATTQTPSSKTTAATAPPAKPTTKTDYRLKAKVTVTLIKKNDKGEVVFNKEYVLRGKDIPEDLLKKDMWTDNFRLMLPYRALSYAVRLYAPDVLEGGHSREESQAYARVEAESIEEIKKLVENN